MRIDDDHDVIVFDFAYSLGFRAGLLEGRRRSIAALQQGEAEIAGETIAVTRGNIGLEEYMRSVEIFNEDSRRV